MCTLVCVGFELADATISQLLDIYKNLLLARQSRLVHIPVGM